MAFFWTCQHGHVSTWADDERPDEDGGCPVLTVRDGKSQRCGAVA